MAYKLIFSESFYNDLDEAMSYISNKLYNPSAANRLLSDTQKSISQLSDNPFMYPLYHDNKLAKRGYRYIIVSNFLVFYKVDETAQEVHVSRFLYGSRNITNEI